MKKVIYLLLIALLMVSCGGDSGGSVNIPPKPTTDPKPKGSVVLNYPANNQLCVNPKIVFKWNKVQYATEYVLRVFNASNQKIHKFSVIGTEKELPALDKGKSFSYNVTAKNKSGKLVSETRVFVVEGVGKVNHLPQTTITLDVAKGLVVLKFKDADGDDLKYTLYHSSNSTFEVSNIVSNHKDVPVSVNQIKEIKSISFNQDFWLKVITTDAVGNQSASLVGYRVK